MAEDAGDRTEPATPRRRQEARARGQVARSNDLAPAVLLLTAMSMLYFWGDDLCAEFLVMIRAGLTEDGVSATSAGQYAVQIATRPAGSVAWIAAILMGVSFAVLYFQIGWLITTRPLQPDLSRLNPLKGFGRLFSVRGSSNIVMTVAKLVCIGAAAWLILNHELPAIVGAVQLSFIDLIKAGSGLILKLGLYLSLILFILAIIDYAIQRFQFERDLRMTKQEIRDELKNMEGDPAMKRRRHEVHRQLAFHQIKRAVPKADVVIANPTHFSIALAYDAERMAAPKVVAKGVDFLALRIREIAQAAGVPVVERPTLARAMYDQVEVGQVIPEQFYQAIAEILAYVYEITGRRVAPVMPGTERAVGA